MPARYGKCLERLTRAAGRQLSDKEVEALYGRLHRAALAIKNGEKPEKLGTKGAIKYGWTMQSTIEKAAAEAAEQMKIDAAIAAKQANLQVLKLGARMKDVDTMKAAGVKDLDAVENTIARNYTGRVNVESLEQRVDGWKAQLKRQLMPTWDALGDDFLGFFQDRNKLITLVRELRGEDTGDQLAKKGAEAFHATAEEARQAFNAAGGVVGKLDDWGMPQHHSQEKVANAAGKSGPANVDANQQAWVDAILPKMDRAKYVDDLDVPRDEPWMRDFLGHAWDTIATNGHANIEPGKAQGTGKRANAHAEHRQIHFQSAQDYIDYWNQFGERTAVEILMGHVDSMARDVAFIEHFGPNPNVTFETLKDQALRAATRNDPQRTVEYEGKVAQLEGLWESANGSVKPTYRKWVSDTADTVANLNVAGKLGGASIASLFGDKVTAEAVSHMNNIPLYKRWVGDLALYNPANDADRRAIQREGLMLDGVRSGLQRFYEGLGKSSTTGKLANGVMRITGMNAINEIRKGGFGLNLMSAIGHEISAGREWDTLDQSDVRTLRNYGITVSDWKTWQQATLVKLGDNANVLTPEAISRIPTDALIRANVIGQAEGDAEAAIVRKNATVKLLGAVNTESEFAVVNPGWRERATFYADLQRGTAKGEIWRSVLQFKSFPWAMFQRGMDLVANQDGAVGKAAMTAYMITATTLAGAMIMQTRDMLTGKDPREMNGDNWWKFWGTAFLQGGALGIYGDFLYSANQSRYGSGPLEAMAGPTVGPLLSLGIVQPLNAARATIEGKQNHLAAQTVQQLKGFVPGNNIWYTKAALDHLIWQNVMEQLSPGYLGTIRQKTMQDYHQDWWWQPGETSPERHPDLSKAMAR